jgi:ferredoxin--NADP+ reductase
MIEATLMTEATRRQPPKPHLPDAQTVTQVTHWTDRLFSFRVTRPQVLRFRSGEFVMIGLMGDTGKPLLRAYSIASPAWDEELEFYSIKVPDGPLTSRLQHIQVGDEIILRPKPVGTLVHDALLPGKRLWFLATGTGFAPFRQPDARTRDLREVRPGHHDAHLPRGGGAGIWPPAGRKPEG